MTKINVVIEDNKNIYIRTVNITPYEFITRYKLSVENIVDLLKYECTKTLKYKFTLKKLDIEMVRKEYIKKLEDEMETLRVFIEYLWKM